MDIDPQIYLDVINSLNASATYVAHRLRQFDKAIKILKVSIELLDTWTQTYIDIGVCYLEQGKYLEARQWFADCLKIDPDFMLAHIGYAVTFWALGDIVTGAAAYEGRINKRWHDIYAEECDGIVKWDG